MVSQGSTGVAQSNCNLNKICDSMLTGLAYVQSHTDDNLLYCSLDPYICWVVRSPNRVNSALCLWPSLADGVYVSLGTAGTYPGYGPVYRNVPW